MTTQSLFESQYKVFSIITEEEKKLINNEIFYGKELKFNYIDLDKLQKLLEFKGFDTKDLSHLEILKFNYEYLFLQISDYFPNIKINKFLNSPCIKECYNFNIDSTYKYDIYIVLTQDDKTFEYGLDFFDSIIDCPPNKYEHSKIFLDNYEYFYSEDINSNKDIKYYLEETLFKLLIAICSILDDEYKLTEILFMKMNKDTMEPKKLKRTLGYCTRLLNWNKTNTIDLEDLYDNLKIINEENKKEINFIDFKKIIKIICDKYNIRFDLNQKDINFNIIGKIILNINTKYSSEILEFYKHIYQIVMEMIPKSLKLIIQLTNEMNMRKKFISKYIEYVIEFKLDDYKNKDILNKIYMKKINNKKNSFDKIREQINEYYDNNQHEENKLENIINNFNLLFDDVFNF